MDVGEFLISGTSRAAQNLAKLGVVTRDGSALNCGSQRIECGSEDLAAALLQAVEDLEVTLTILDQVDDPGWSPPILESVRGLLRDIADEGVSDSLTARINDLLSEPVTERLPLPPL